MNRSRRWKDSAGGMGWGCGGRGSSRGKTGLRGITVGEDTGATMVAVASDKSGFGAWSLEARRADRSAFATVRQRAAFLVLVLIYKYGQPCPLCFPLTPVSMNA